MLWLWFAAQAAEVAPWLAAVEQEVDAALPALRSCVTFTHAVDPEYPELARFELAYAPSAVPRVVLKDATFEEGRVSSCLATALTRRVWPGPPYRPSAAGFTVSVTADRIVRKGRAFVAPPMPSELEEVAALPPEALWIATRKMQIGKRCLRARAALGGEDISAHLEMEVGLSAEGRLVPGRVAGGSYDPALRDCVLAELAAVPMPRGYAATPPFLLAVDLAASRSGGEMAGAFAGSDADGGWRWKTRVYYLGRPSSTPSGPPESNVARWLYRAQRALSKAKRNVQGCVLADPAQRADQELLLVAGPNGLEEVLVATSTGAALAGPCVVRTVEEAGIPAFSTRVVVGTRIEVLTGPATVFTGLAPLAARPGKWSEALIPALVAGDAEAFTAALPAAVDRAHHDWSTGPLAELPPVSWRVGGDWPTWDRLVVSKGSLDEAERQADFWAAEATGCVEKPTTERRRILFVAMHVDAEGIVRVDEPLENSVGKEAESCIRSRIEGQTLGRSSVEYSAFWAARP